MPASYLCQGQKIEPMCYHSYSSSLDGLSEQAPGGKLEDGASATKHMLIERPADILSVGQRAPSQCHCRRDHPRYHGARPTRHNFDWSL